MQLGERLRADALELVQLVLGEAHQAVAQPVRERVLGEPGVAVGRTERDVLRLDEQDVARRVALLRDQRGPQPGEAAADDRQVALELALHRRTPFGSAVEVQPERPWHGTGEEVVEAPRFSRAQSVTPRNERGAAQPAVIVPPADPPAAPPADPEEKSGPFDVPPVLPPPVAPPPATGRPIRGT